MLPSALAMRMTEGRVGDLDAMSKPILWLLLLCGFDVRYQRPAVSRLWLYGETKRGVCKGVRVERK